MRVLVCGGRDFGNDGRNGLQVGFINATLEAYARKWCPRYASGELMLPCGIHIIAGGARGVDTVAIDYAVVNWLPFTEFPAQWDKYGKRAGYLRNQQMLDEGKPDIVLAFPGGKGTAMMVKLAREASIPVEIIEYRRKEAA